jgi:hypothetical protein
MTVKELRKCLEGIDENLQVLIPRENAYVALNYVTLSLLRRELDDDYLKAIVLKATLKEQKENNDVYDNSSM